MILCWHFGMPNVAAAPCMQHNLTTPTTMKRKTITKNTTQIGGVIKIEKKNKN